MVLHLNVSLASNKDWGRDEKVADIETCGDLIAAI